MVTLIHSRGLTLIKGRLYPQKNSQAPMHLEMGNGKGQKWTWLRGGVLTPKGSRLPSVRACSFFVVIHFLALADWPSVSIKIIKKNGLGVSIGIFMFLLH